MKYRREIDGLRAVAVLPVILFHAGFETFSGGFVGVDIFFVISGYLITTILLAELKQGDFSVVNFYERRARRILPALFTVMLACISIAWFCLLPADMKEFSSSLIAVSIFGSNIFFSRTSGYFDTAVELKPLLHTWSLAVEEQYYVFFPLVLMLFWKLGKRWILVTLGLVFVASLAVAQWAAYAKPTAAFYLLPTRGWELLIGAFAAFYLSQANRKDFGKGLSEFGGWLGVALIFYSVFFYSKTIPFPSVYALVPTIGAALIILFATQQTTVGKFVGNNAFVGVGLISYSAYLWHQPLFAFYRHTNPINVNHFTLGFLSIISLAVGFFSWKYIESPFRKSGLFTRRHVFSLAFSLTLLFIAFGYFGKIHNGFEERYTRVLSGDIGHIEFHQYIDQKYFDCEPTTVAENALSWGEYLRCKQSKQGTPDIILLGDSHAEHLFLGLAEFIPGKNIAFYILSEAPYLNNKNFRPIFDELIFNKKTQRIILAMHFIGRVDSKGTGLYEGYSSTISALLKSGKSITLVSDVPRFNQDAALCVYSHMGKPSSSCILSREEVRHQREVYDGILARLAKDFKVSYLRIDETLCSELACGMSKDDQILYRDNNHLNIIGSKLVGKSLAEMLAD
jgi:peptidoglycan/LPS O-acetylase OafA/YrhL